jgi:hypothetical protein
MAATPPTLTCPQCSYVNEAERVYCHNCGGKLDRSLLPKEEERGKQSIEKTRRRVKKLTNPGSSPITRELKTLVSTLAWAAAIAALILIVRTPEGVPEKSPAELPSRIVGSELADAVDSPQPRALQFTEEEVNAHLRQSLKAKTSGDLVTFDRAFVSLEPGVLRITMQQSLYGFSIYSASYYKLAMEGGKLAATNVGGRFGRLAVHPLLMQYADFSFNKLWKALQREREQMDKLREIRVEPKRIVLITRGRTP